MRLNLNKTGIPGLAFCFVEIFSTFDCQTALIEVNSTAALGNYLYVVLGLKHEVIGC
jgi:hypothetical protein